MCLSPRCGARARDGVARGGERGVGRTARAGDYGVHFSSPTSLAGARVGGRPGSISCRRSDEIAVRAAPDTREGGESVARPCVQRPDALDERVGTRVGSARHARGRALTHALHPFHRRRACCCPRVFCLRGTACGAARCSSSCCSASAEHLQACAATMPIQIVVPQKKMLQRTARRSR